MSLFHQMTEAIASNLQTFLATISIPVSLTGILIAVVFDAPKEASKFLRGIVAGLGIIGTWGIYIRFMTTLPL